MSGENPPLAKKRIIVCCDGTWQNADNGFTKPTKSDPVPKLQVSSNVARISRSFKRRCSDGTFQIIYYQSGVGSRFGTLDRFLGGAFGCGLSENVREAYAFICANYFDGDEIVLVGFSRGAFTARSIGGLISDLGLLTREGMEYFYPVYKDMQNWLNPRYNDPFPNLPFADKPKGPNADDIYRERLVEMGYTRTREKKGQGDFIKVKAIGVWDTVGSLGIPFYNTKLSGKIEHAFHALALDESRGPFTPTLWERPEDGEITDLRQVWFPGSHSNVGGGWEDQGIADITLAWMMDQLSSVKVEFLDNALDKFFEDNIKLYHREPPSKGMLETLSAYLGGFGAAKAKLPWATKEIMDAHAPVRPWSLQMTRSVKSAIWDLAGNVIRSPGMYKKIDPETGRPTKEFLEQTNERIHSSVRVRLACEGLGVNDSAPWDCSSLLKHWHPHRVTQNFKDPVSRFASWGPQSVRISPQVMNTSKTNHGTAEGSTLPNIDLESPDELRLVWEYIGPEKNAPPVTMMVEENMGPFERHLLQLSSANMEVFGYAEKKEPNHFKAMLKKGSGKVKETREAIRTETGA
ncbi:hypothetical protein F4810DRAFT_709060 [Camillea tinctor]|nr:hypothetical protein F4810DRAFT_709060 [Camillea tinctor]